jgi:hypothetical protein
MKMGRFVVELKDNFKNNKNFSETNCKMIKNSSKIQNYQVEPLICK